MYSGLYDYLKQNPKLKDGIFNFDFIGSSFVEYTVAMIPNTPLLSKQINGDETSKLDFMIISVESFGTNPNIAMENLEILQDLKKWFRTQNRRGNFPDMGADKKVTGVYGVDDPNLERQNESGDTGFYQIFCRVEYIQINDNPTRLPFSW